MKSFFSSAWNILKVLLIHSFIGIPYMMVANAVYIFIWIREGSLLTFETFQNKFVDMMATQIPITMIVSAVASFFIYKWMMKKRKRNIYEVCRFNKLSLDKVIVSFVIGMSFLFLSLFLVSILEFFVPGSLENHEQNMTTITQGGVLLLILNAGIAAPFIEEIMFRGIIFDELERKISLKLTIIIQGLLFGLYHLNIVQGLYASVLGIFLGLSLVWTGSIWAPILIHLGNNLFSIFLGVSGIEYMLDGLNPIVMWLISIIAVFVVLPLGMKYLYKNRIDFIPRTPIHTEIDESNTIESDSRTDFKM